MRIKCVNNPTALTSARISNGWANSSNVQHHALQHQAHLQQTSHLPYGGRTSVCEAQAAKPGYKLCAPSPRRSSVLAPCSRFFAGPALTVPICERHTLRSKRTKKPESTCLTIKLNQSRVRYPTIMSSAAASSPASPIAPPHSCCSEPPRARPGPASIISAPPPPQPV
mgnify:CR=1 FL=1